MGCETGFFASMQSGIHPIGFWRVSDAWKPLVRHFRVVLDWYPNHQIRSHVRVLCRTFEPSNRAPSRRPSSSGCILTLPPEASKRTPLPNPLPFGRGEGERYGSGGSIKMRPGGRSHQRARMPHPRSSPRLCELTWKEKNCQEPI